MALKDKWNIDLKSTALIIIDMQNGYLTAGAPVYCPKAVHFIPKINELSGICRSLGIPVIFVCASYRPDLSDIGLREEIRPLTDSILEVLEGRKSAEVVNGLNVEKSDYIVKKCRYSAFIGGSSSLEPLLRTLGRDILLICGIATDVCVGATVIDGMMLNFRMLVIGDLTATMNEERQKVALEVLNMHFARVITLSEAQKQMQLLKETGLKETM